MKITRRKIVSAFVYGATATMASPAISSTRRRRVSQIELDDALIAHALWCRDMSHGKRAVFSECDLSGLLLSCDDLDDGGRVDLCGADFTQADMRGIVGEGQILFKGACFQGANLSESNLGRPIFANSNLRNIDCSRAKWGRFEEEELAPGYRKKCPTATFANCWLGYSTFDDARICATFDNTSLHNGSLKHTDLSHSVFYAQDDLHLISFAGCDLQNASFQDADLVGASFDDRTNLSGAIFSGARLAVC